MTNTIALLATLLACSCYGGETDPQLGTQPVHINVQPGQCLVVYRYDSREPFLVEGVEMAELCLELGSGPVALERASVVVAIAGECSCAYQSRSR